MRCPEAFVVEPTWHGNTYIVGKGRRKTQQEYAVTKIKGNSFQFTKVKRAKIEDGAPTP